MFIGDGARLVRDAFALGTNLDMLSVIALPIVKIWYNPWYF